MDCDLVFYVVIDSGRTRFPLYHHKKKKKKNLTKASRRIAQRPLRFSGPSRLRIGVGSLLYTVRLREAGGYAAFFGPGRHGKAEGEEEEEKGDLLALQEKANKDVCRTCKTGRTGTPRYRCEADAVRRGGGRGGCLASGSIGSAYAFQPPLRIAISQ